MQWINDATIDPSMMWDLKSGTAMEPQLTVNSRTDLLFILKVSSKTDSDPIGRMGCGPSAISKQVSDVADSVTIITEVMMFNNTWSLRNYNLTNLTYWLLKRTWRQAKQIWGPKASMPMPMPHRCLIVWHCQCRLEICQEIYTTKFSGERILHTENA